MKTISSSLGWFRSPCTRPTRIARSSLCLPSLIRPAVHIHISLVTLARASSASPLPRSAINGRVDCNSNAFVLRFSSSGEVSTSTLHKIPQSHPMSTYLIHMHISYISRLYYIPYIKLHLFLKNKQMNTSIYSSYMNLYLQHLTLHNQIYKHNSNNRYHISKVLLLVSASTSVQPSHTAVSNASARY